MLIHMFPRRWPAAFIASTLFVISSARIGGQTVTVDPQQCFWRAGDDLGWAAPNLDESSWQPYSTLKLNPTVPQIWIRCHADLSSLRSVVQPGLQIRLAAAYQAYLDGKVLGGVGNLQDGAFDMNIVRDWPLTGDFASTNAIALRVIRHYATAVPVGPLPPLEINAGDETLLRNRQKALAFDQMSGRVVSTLCFSIDGILGLILLGLWINDRSRTELFLLSVTSVALAFIYLNYFCAAALLAYPMSAYFLIWAAGGLAGNVTRVLFFFTLAGKRLPLWFWLPICLSVIPYATTAAVPFLAPVQALKLEVFRSHPVELVAYLARAFVCLVPYLVFLPWKKLQRRMKPLAALCMVWGVTLVTFYTVRLTSAQIPGIPDLQARFGLFASDLDAVVNLGVLVALFALLFREQQQTAKERAILAGEMRAAQHVQRMLAPASLEAVPSAQIEAAFHPIREVGGDFYSCRKLDTDRQRILIGDVSGKGAAAAMTAAVLIGAAQRRDSETPAALLQHLNLVLADMNVSGFATCLCAELSSDGTLTVANAGHLPPYLGGRELPLPSGLPLGISPEAEYLETTLQLAPSDTLTFLSDGVVEARNLAGELFGFDRACAISRESAESICRAAQAFGQEDDITVLTLKFAPQSVASTLA